MLYPFIFIALSFINLQPVCDNDIELENLFSVIQAVLSKPYCVMYPQIFPYVKIIWIVCLILAFLGNNIVFCIFGFISMLLIGIFQSMGDIESWDYVWLVSNTVAFLFVAFYFIYELIVKENDLNYRNIKKSRLWLLLFFPILFWYPVVFENGKYFWDFTLHALLYNDAGVAFCYVAPTLLTVLILHYPYVNRRLFGVVTLVCSIMGFMSMVLFIHSRMIPMVVMHIPLVMTSIYGHFLYFFGSVKKVKIE